MLIADTRPHPQDEADLRWLWCESEGAMGLRSSLGAQLDRLAEGRVTAHQSRALVRGLRRQGEDVRVVRLWRWVATG